MLLVACPQCPPAREARAMFLDLDVVSNLLIALLPFAVCLAAVFAILRFSEIRRGSPMTRIDDPGNRMPLIGAGLLLGIGLGGFVDGILLHQILQWHNMLSSRVPPTTLVTMKYNMIWDGLFHALVWAMTAGGIAWLFRAGRRVDSMWSGRVLFGAMLGGWGLFNVVEGTIDHLLLGIHHVHPGPDQVGWDLGFLIAGIVLMIIGATGAVARPGRTRVPARRAIR
jgi:uncharacterized membrane protein